MRVTPGNWRFAQVNPLYGVELRWIELELEAANGYMAEISSRMAVRILFATIGGY
jgi:hypothetical protein